MLNSIESTRMVIGGRRFRGVVPLALALALSAGGGFADEPSAAPKVAAADAGERAWLGVVLADAVDGGVRIAGVLPGGPAEQAGLRAGDLILVLDGLEVADRSVVDRVLDRVEPGASVQVRVLRKGEIVERPLRTTARSSVPFIVSGAPRAPRRSGAAPRPSLTVAPRVAMTVDVSSLLQARLAAMSPELRVHYGAPEDSGLLVVRVEPGEARRAALEVGDVVVRMCGQPLRHPSQISPCALSPPDADEAASLEVVRGKERQVLRLELPAGYARQPLLAPEATATATASQVRARLIEAEIERLEKRLRALRRELDELR